MDNHFSSLDTETRSGLCYRFLQSGVLVVAAALLCTPLFAVAADDVARARTTSAPQDAWVSGGVSEEAREEMRKVAGAYNVHLVFSSQSGSYLADIPFTVARLAAGKRQEILSAVSDGPFLYLKLPPGSYEIAAKIAGVWQSQRIQVGAPGSSRRVSFVSKSP